MPDHDLRIVLFGLSVLVLSGCETQQPKKPIPAAWLNEASAICVEEDLDSKFQQSFCHCMFDKIGVRMDRDEFMSLGLDMNEAEDELAEIQMAWKNKKVKTIVLDCMEEIGQTES